MTTVFESEIRAQGAVLRGRAEAGMTQAVAVARAWAECEYALVAARGSSDNAARFFQYLAGQERGLLVSLAAPSLYEGERRIGLSGAGVMAISQSGRSPGMTEVLAQARDQGRPTVAVTNDVTAPLATLSDVVIDLAAGPEHAIASSKTLSATWHALAQVVSALGPEPLAGLATIADDLDGVIGWVLESSLPLSRLDVAGGLTVVGRGVGYAAASEISLKIREVSGIRAEAFAASDFVHGPIGADGSQSTLLLVVTDETTDDLAGAVVEDCRARGMATVELRPPERASHGADDDIELPGTAANWATGLFDVVVGQVLALRLGEARGRPIDTSPGLAKITYRA